MSEHERERLGEQAEAVTPRAVVRLIDLLREVISDVKEGGDPRLPLELALVKVMPAPERACAGGAGAAAVPAGVWRTIAAGGTAQPTPAPPAAAAKPTPPPRRLSTSQPKLRVEVGRAAAGTEPVSPPAAAAATLDQVAERWSDAILPEIGRRATPLHALVVSARPVAFEDGELVIGLPASQSFAKGMIETPQNLRLVTEVVGQALGGTPRVRFVVAGEEQPQPGEAAAAPEQVSEDELVSRLTQEFDAHEV